MYRFTKVLAGAILCSLSSTSHVYAKDCVKGTISSTKEQVWYCKADNTINITRITAGSKKQCNLACNKIGETSTPSLTEGDLISVGAADNADWLNNFSTQGFKTGDAYTTIKVDFQGRIPSEKACSRYKGVESFLRSKSGIENAKDVNFSIVLTHGTFNPKAPSGRGLLVPVFTLSKEKNKDCKLEYHVKRDLVIAKVKADENVNLRVTGVYSFSETQTVFDGVENTVNNSSVLSKILNGSLAAYAPSLTELFSLDGFRTTRNDNLSISTSLPIYPVSSKDARIFSVAMSSQDHLNIRVSQVPLSNPEGGLAEADTLTEAISLSDTVVDFAKDGSTLLFQSLQQDLSVSPKIDFSVPGKDSTSIGEMKEFCDRLVAVATREYGLSGKAKNKLLALSMREYSRPEEFYTSRAGRIACIPLNQRPEYQEIFLEGITSQQADQIRSAIGG